jgi:hypothetical protein
MGKSNRCFVCRKKLGLLFFTCKCDENKMYCSNHRLDHNCNFDYKKMEKDKLEKNIKDANFIKVDKI